MESFSSKPRTIQIQSNSRCQLGSSRRKCAWGPAIHCQPSCAHAHTLLEERNWQQQFFSVLLYCSWLRRRGFPGKFAFCLVLSEYKAFCLTSACCDLVYSEQHLQKRWWRTFLDDEKYQLRSDETNYVHSNVTIRLESWCIPPGRMVPHGQVVRVNICGKGNFGRLV